MIIKSLLRLRAKTQNQVLLDFIRYGIVGLLGTVVHTLVLAISVEYFHFAPVFGTMLGFVFSLLLSYYLNAKWTFRNNHKNKKSFIKYTITCLLGLSINVCIMFVIVNLLGYWYVLGQIVAILIVPLFNYTISRYWVFNKEKF